MTDRDMLYALKDLAATAHNLANVAEDESRQDTLPKYIRDVRRAVANAREFYSQNPPADTGDRITAPAPADSEVALDLALSWLERIGDQYEDECGCDNHENGNCCLDRHARCAKCYAEVALAEISNSITPSRAAAPQVEPPCGLCGSTASRDGDWYRVCGPCRWRDGVGDQR